MNVINNININIINVGTSNRPVESLFQPPPDSFQSSSMCNESSQMGQMFAKLASQSAGHANYASDKRKIQRDGLNNIVSNYNTTQDEKTLAGLAIKIGDRDIGDTNVVNARNVILNAISAPVSGPIGQVLAYVTSNAANSVSYDSNKRLVQRDGLNEIVSNYKTSQDEKTLANLAIKIGDRDIGDTNIVNVRDTFLSAISGNIGGPIGQVIAYLMNDATNKVSYDNNKRLVQRDGLDEILSNPKVTQDEKTLAQLAVKFGDRNIGDTNVKNVREVVLSALSRPINGSMGTTIAQLTNEATNTVSYDSNKRLIQRDGLDAMLSNPKVSDYEKTLAKLAVKFGDRDIGDTNIKNVREVILSALANNIDMPINSAIAQLTYEASNKVSYDSNKRQIQRDGLDAMLSNPYLTNDQRALVQMAVQMGEHGESDSAVVQSRNEILRMLF